MFASAWRTSGRCATSSEGRLTGNSCGKSRVERSNASVRASLGNLPNVTFTPGGITLLVGSEPIGGIGVGGAPGGNFDDECAQAAIDKIKDRMK